MLLVVLLNLSYQVWFTTNR